MFCNWIRLSCVLSLGLAALGCEPPPPAIEGEPFWIPIVPPVSAQTVYTSDVPTDGPIEFEGTLNLGRLPEFEGEQPTPARLIDALRFRATGCGDLVELWPQTVSMVSADSNLNAELLPTSTPEAKLSILPAAAGTFTIVLEGEVPDGWGFSCGAFSEHDGSFVVTLQIAVHAIEEVSVAPPGRCGDEETLTYFDGDSLESLVFSLRMDNVPPLFDNLPPALPIPLRLRTSIAGLRFEVGESLRDVVLPSRGEVVLDGPGLAPLTIRVANVDDVASASASFILPGVAALNKDLDMPVEGEDGWGRTRNAIVPTVTSVQLDDGTTPCTIRTPPMQLESRSDDVCEVRVTTSPSAVTDSGAFDPIVYQWWAEQGFYGHLFGDGECQLTLTSAQEGFSFSQDLDVTILNVDELTPVDTSPTLP